eukprot:1149948-Pelagomonas_calceolata.AAC.6
MRVGRRSTGDACLVGGSCRQVVPNRGGYCTMQGSSCWGVPAGAGAERAPGGMCCMRGRS